MKKISLLLLVLVLSGCAGIDTVVTKVGEDIDKSVSLGEYLTCESLTVASLKRTHCRTKEGCERWASFCSTYSGDLETIESGVSQ